MNSKALTEPSRQLPLGFTDVFSKVCYTDKLRVLMWIKKTLKYVVGHRPTSTWRRGCAWAVTVGGQSEGSPQTRWSAALGRHGSVRLIGWVLAGCAACGDADGGGGGGGVKNMAVHFEVMVWTLSADHCRWSRGSPGRSSYHWPGPLNQHHPLEETDRDRSQGKINIKQISSKNPMSLKCKTQGFLDLEKKTNQ